MALWVDDLQEVTESNENDNLSLSSTQANIENTLPDLAVETWYASWDGAGNGTLEYIVYNNGASSESNSDWDINLVLSPDEFIGNSNEIYLFYEDAGFQLDPGQNVYRNSLNPAYFNLLTDYFGDGVPSGQYHMALWVDDLDQVDESNELNNYSLGADLVSIGVAPKPSGLSTTDFDDNLNLQNKATENSAYN